jgi:hypothetical protein
MITFTLSEIAARTFNLIFDAPSKKTARQHAVTQADSWLADSFGIRAHICKRLRSPESIPKKRFR